MALQINGIILDELSADPGSPTDGQIWYNTTEDRFKCSRGGSVESFSDLDELTAHIADSANPHTTTLEQARTAGNTVSGPIDMGGNLLNNVATPVALTDAATAGYVTDQINQKLQGLDWQESVIDKDLATPPGSPTTGDRYIVASGGTGAWVGQDDAIAEWDGTAWVFATPNEGFMTRVMDEDIFYLYDGAAWGQFLSITDHGALSGLADDDHTQYTRADGTRAFTGSQSFGGFNITNVGTVDGVDVSAHAARHITGGADEIDGDQIDIDFTPSNYTPSITPTEVSNLDHLSAHLAGIDDALVAAAGGLTTKAGSVAAGSFTGNPKQATVAFSTAFPSTPTVTATAEVSTGNRRFNVNVLSVTTTGFTLDLGTNVTTNLLSVKWQAIAVGES